jgi:hypothetical protein
LHNYIASQLAAKIKDRRIVVMYDPRREFAAFFEELLEGAQKQGDLSIDSARPWKIRYLDLAP